MDVNDAHATPHVRYFALLIGIDTYSERPLLGAARDVRGIKQLLTDKFPACRITSLVASHGHDVADGEIKPTWSNFKQALDRLIEQVKSGDTVYIHFSGHGTCFGRNKSSANLDSTGNVPKSSNYSTNDLALNLLADDGDEDSGHLEYLYGYDLALSLKRIIDEGASVTMALDCCYSGSVVRDEDCDGVRSLRYNAEVAGRSRWMNDEFLEGLPSHIFRDTSMHPNWIVNPTGYSILTACGATEKAYEDRVDKLRAKDSNRKLYLSTKEGEEEHEVMHGVFSFYLIETLSMYDRGCLNSDDLNRQLRALMRDRNISQNPTFYGVASTLFSPKTDSSVGESQLYSVVSRGKDAILSAGEVHGIRLDDVIQVRAPAHITDLSVKCKVVKCLLFTSILDPLSELRSSSIETGWMGSLLANCAVKLCSVRLSEDIPFLEEVQAAITKQRFPRVMPMEIEKQPYIYLSNSGDGQLQIRNDNTRHAISIDFSIGQPDFAERVAELIYHLERYESSRCLKSTLKNGIFQETHVITVRDPFGEIIHKSDSITVESGDEIRFDIQNKCKSGLYVYVYGWGPHYEVNNNLLGSYIAIPCRRKETGHPGRTLFSVDFTLPVDLQVSGLTQCRDFLKIIITSHPTDFQYLDMPALLGNDEKDMKSSNVKTFRGNGDNIPIKVEVDENWAVYDFIVDTKIEDK